MTKTAPARPARRDRPFFDHRPLDQDARITQEARAKIEALAPHLPGGLPTMFEFAPDRTGAQVYQAVGVSFKPAFLDLLGEVEQRRKALRSGEQGRLPTSMLRLLLGTQVPGALRIETNLWKLANSQPRLPLLISSQPQKEVARGARKALAAWAMKVPDLDENLRATLEDRIGDGVFEFAEIKFDPAHPGERYSHRDLADMAAHALDGVELFPGRGPMRRIVSRDMSSNVAELMTDPYVAGTRRSEVPTSYVVKFRTKTFAGQRTPRLVMELSRRQWTDNVSTFFGTVTLYALPSRTEEDPNPAVITLNVDWKQHKKGTPALDYEGLRQRFPTLPEDLFTDRRVVPQLLAHPDCQVLAVARQGRGVKGGATGAPDVDRFLAFAIAAAELERYGLRPWHGLTRIEGLGKKEGQTPSEPFQALFAEPVPTEKQIANGTAAKVVKDKKDAARAWAEAEQSKAQQHYGHAYRLLLLHAGNQEDSAAKAALILEKALGDQITITRQAMPDQTSGPEEGLPGNGLKPAERAALRLEKWNPYLRATQGTFDGVMLVVPRGDGDDTNDPVNKRASKIAILRELKVHAQYLRPAEEGKDDKDFIRRTIRAFQDLAWESIGLLVPVEDHSGEFGGDTMHGRILALTVATVNSSRDRDNKPTTVPMGLRLDLSTQQTEAQLLLPKGRTGWVSLREATFQLQSSTSKLNPKAAADRKGVQEFFNTLLDEAQEGKVEGRAEIVFLDGDTISSYWKGLYDSNLEINDLRFEPREGKHRLQLSWPDLTLLRLRSQDRFSKVLRQGEQEIEVLGVRFPTPRWTESEAYVIGDPIGVENPAGATFLSIGATNGQMTRGKSGSLRTTKIKGKAERNELQPYTDGYATPEALEVAVITAGGLGIRGIVDITSKLRRRYAHYDGWTKMPAPLSFAHLIKNYVPDYGSDGEEEEVLDLGSD